MVAGEPRFRFYAGHAVRAGGYRVGALCVIDHRPRELRPEDVRALEDLAALAEQELTARPPRPAGDRPR
jgi:GAF domain-containing protein